MNVLPRGIYEIKSDKMIHIHIKHVHVEFQRGNNIFKLVIIVKHIYVRGPILDLGAIMEIDLDLHLHRISS